jgi:chaperonin GroEL
VSAPKLEGDQKVGAEIVRRALEEPIRQIVANAGVEGAIVVQEVMSKKDVNYGFNCATETYGDLKAMGVIDPAKVTRTALENAASVAGLMLMTEITIHEIPEEKSPAMPGGGMGGMGDMM